MEHSTVSVLFWYSFQSGGEGMHILKTVSRTELQTLFQNGTLPGKEMGEPGKRLWRTGIQAVKCLCRRTASQGKIYSGAESIYIDPCTNFTIADILFWWGIPCFQDYSILCCSVVLAACGAEINEMEIVVRAEDQVVWTDIAMNKPLVMNFCQGLDDRQDQFGDFGKGEGSVFIYILTQCQPFDILHYDIGSSIFFKQIIDRYDAFKPLE